MPWTASEGRLSRWATLIGCVFVPGFFLVVTLLAYAAHSTSAPSAATPGRPLALRIVRQASPDWTPAQARERVRVSPRVAGTSSNLSEEPFWALVDLPGSAAGRPRWLEWPSRHAIEASCWRGHDLVPLGRADRDTATGRVVWTRAGFAVDLAAVPIAESASVLCRLRHIGPARITALAWSDAGLAEANRQLEYQTGFVKGGILFLGLFAILLAVLEKDMRFVLLVAWLLLGLRMGLISLGVDQRWLDVKMPQAWLPMLRKLTVACFYLVTFQLHLVLLPVQEKVTPTHRIFIGTTQVTAVALLILAAVLPYRLFLPAMWLVVGVGIASAVADILRVVWHGTSRPTLWFGTALLIILAVAVWEIVTAALGLPTGFFNFESGILLSSCFVVGAFAVQMQEEVRQRKLAQAELLRTYGNIPVGLFTLERDTGRFRRVNRAMQQLWGDGARALAATQWDEHFEPGSWNRLHAALLRDTRADLHLGGGERPGERSFHVIATAVDDHIEGSVHDVTVRRRATERLRYLAENDMLTGVLNRATFEQRLSEVLHAVLRGGQATLIFVNLRRFRLINELYGLKAGDQLLREVAALLLDGLAPGQVLGRLTGDGFGVLVPDDTAAAVREQGLRMAERIGHETFRQGEQAIRLKAGVGVIDVTAEMAYSDALALAENAAREARDDLPVVLYDQEAARLRDWAFQNELIRLLEKPTGFDGFYLLFQPIVALRQPSRAHNFEVLLRMNDPQGQAVPIGQLLAAAEAGGLMSRVDLWVMETTLTWLEQHRSALGNTRFVCLNLSGTSLNDLNFVDAASHCLRRHAEVAPYLCLEVTESVALQDYAHTRRFMERMKAFGVRFALDDFGAGYSSYAYLTELPVEVLKIDGSLVRDVARHPARAAIVGSIARMAGDLGLRCIAEWVEDVHTLEALIEGGVDYVQGFGLVKPILPARLLEATSGTGLVADPEIRRVLEGLDMDAGNTLH